MPHTYAKINLNNRPECKPISIKQPEESIADNLCDPELATISTKKQKVQKIKQKF